LTCIKAIVSQLSYRPENNITRQDRLDKEQPLRGARVLVAEDNPILAYDMTSVLLKAGAAIIGPALSVERALELAIAEHLSCGVLDIRLRDGLVFPVAQALKRKGIGILFHTAQGDPERIKQDWPDAQVLMKPAPVGLLVPAVQAACCGRLFGL
jgi:DNA-binding NarL/FixJ family response regulator